MTKRRGDSFWTSLKQMVSNSHGFPCVHCFFRISVHTAAVKRYGRNRVRREKAIGSPPSARVSLRGSSNGAESTVGFWPQPGPLPAQCSRRVIVSASPAKRPFDDGEAVVGREVPHITTNPTAATQHCAQCKGHRKGQNAQAREGEPASKAQNKGRAAASRAGVVARHVVARPSVRPKQFG